MTAVFDSHFRNRHLSDTVALSLSLYEQIDSCWFCCWFT